MKLCWPSNWGVAAAKKKIGVEVGEVPGTVGIATGSFARVAVGASFARRGGDLTHRFLCSIKLAVAGIFREHGSLVGEFPKIELRTGRLISVDPCEIEDLGGVVA